MYSISYILAVSCQTSILTLTYSSFEHSDSYRQSFHVMSRSQVDVAIKIPGLWYKEIANESGKKDVQSLSLIYMHIFHSLNFVVPFNPNNSVGPGKSD